MVALKIKLHPFSGLEEVLLSCVDVFLKGIICLVVGLAFFLVKLVFRAERDVVCSV